MPGNLFVGKATKKEKRKKSACSFFYQVEFILILYGENNGN